ncbi:hypothetical protein BH09BAC2_BH09BAC2_09700 [soil metagenome]
MDKFYPFFILKVDVKIIYDDAEMLYSTAFLIS